MTRLFQFVLTVVFVIGTASINAQSTNINIIQGEKVFELKPGNHSILLKKKPFVIRTNVKKYKANSKQFNAIQLSVRHTNEGMCQAGQIISDIPYFAPGTGMATEEKDAYPYLFVNNEAHHYFSFQNKHKKRVKFVNKKDGFVTVEIVVAGFHENAQDIQIEDFKRQELFLDFLINKNLDLRIDPDELTQIHLRFQ